MHLSPAHVISSEVHSEKQRNCCLARTWSLVLDNMDPVSVCLLFSRSRHVVIDTLIESCTATGDSLKCAFRSLLFDDAAKQLVMHG